LRPLRRISARDLLHQPTVAVRILERQERAVVLALGVQAGGLTALGEVERLNDGHVATHELGPGGLDVADDEVQTLERAGPVIAPERDGAG
jgi:hypothetical protein